MSNDVSRMRQAVFGLLTQVIVLSGILREALIASQLLLNQTITKHIWFLTQILHANVLVVSRNFLSIFFVSNSLFYRFAMAIVKLITKTAFSHYSAVNRINFAIVFIMQGRMLWWPRANFIGTKGTESESSMELASVAFRCLVKRNKSWQFDVLLRL